MIPYIIEKNMYYLLKEENKIIKIFYDDVISNEHPFILYYIEFGKLNSIITTVTNLQKLHKEEYPEYYI